MLRCHANTLGYYFTSEIGTQGTKQLAPKCPLFGGSTVYITPHTFLSGVDFVDGQYTVIIRPGETQQCTRLIILNDNTAFEGNEVFEVEATTSSSSTIISTAQVTITDDDGKCSYQHIYICLCNLYAWFSFNTLVLYHLFIFLQTFHV